MAITGVGSTPTTSASQSATASLASNFDTFLTLLTTQLKNQDPLSPMDSNEFTQQLVQFSQVEQQINSNKNLETLIAMTKSSSTNAAVSYLGKYVTVTDGTASLENGAANWDYALDGSTVATSLIVTNSAGKVVYAGTGETGEGTHSFAWDGKDNAGNALPDGTYKLQVVGYLSDGTKVGTSVASTGQVTEVDLTGEEPMLVIGTMRVPLSSAALVSNS